MKLSVIIPCFNPGETLAEQLESLSGQDWPGGWEVLLADNASTDNFREIAESYRSRLPELRIISCTEKQGPGYARNQGAKKAAGEALLFCDADDIAGPNWLREMGEALTTHDFVAGRLNVHEINPEWTVRSRPEITTLLNDGVMTTHDYLPWASSANLGMRKEIFLKNGGFDERIPAAEDVDLCWRVQRSGVKLAFVPGAVMHYRLRDSFRGIFRQSQSYAENFVLLYKLYQPLGLAPPAPSLRSLLRHWYRLAKDCPVASRRKERTAEWIWQAGWRLGCLKGSLKHRFFVP